MDKSLNMIGLCMKAGKVVSGEFTVETTLKSSHGYLVIVAEDASENTKKKFKNMCTYRNVAYVEKYSKESLGKAIGKDIRATICITDEKFAQTIENTWR